MTEETWERLAPLLERLEDAFRRKPYVLAAIDGRCGSGKTTLAARLASRWPSRLLHMDDFYLPFPERAPGWERIPGGNIDLERFLREALLPARAGETIRYRRCDCHAGRFEEPVELAPAPLTIVEGSYSLHPRLSGLYDLTVFLTCSPEEQLRRLREREGENFPSFPARWIPMEERYFALFGAEGRADFAVKT